MVWDGFVLRWWARVSSQSTWPFQLKASFVPSAIDVILRDRKISTVILRDRQISTVILRDRQIFTVILRDRRIFTVILRDRQIFTVFWEQEGGGEEGETEARAAAGEEEQSPPSVVEQQVSEARGDFRNNKKCTLIFNLITFVFNPHLNPSICARAPCVFLRCPWGRRGASPPRWWWRPCRRTGRRGAPPGSHSHRGQSGSLGGHLILCLSGPLRPQPPTQPWMGHLKLGLPLHLTLNGSFF